MKILYISKKRKNTYLLALQQMIGVPQVKYQLDCQVNMLVEVV